MHLVEQETPCGLYHLANAGQASLYELITEIVTGLKLPTRVEQGSHLDFPSIGRKNICTPIRSEKIPPMRPWKEAVAAYCQQMAQKWSPKDV
jgi:dTDP-4-dehydrorhamnose reductase